MLKSWPGRLTLFGALLMAVTAFGVTGITTGQVATIEARSPAVCSFKITATNKGATDIWIMFYTSKVKQGCLTCTWRQMMIKNHLVAPGASIQRTYDAHGPCYTHRDWHFDLKKGSNASYKNAVTGKNSEVVSIGDVSQAF